jgi:hypothetical protein
MSGFTFSNGLALWGVLLSTPLAALKIWETWSARRRIVVSSYLSVGPGGDHRLQLTNLSRSPILLRTWAIVPTHKFSIWRVAEGRLPLRERAFWRRRNRRSTVNLRLQSPRAGAWSGRRPRHSSDRLTCSSFSRGKSAPFLFASSQRNSDKARSATSAATAKRHRPNQPRSPRFGRAALAGSRPRSLPKTPRAKLGQRAPRRTSAPPAPLYVIIGFTAWRGLERPRPGMLYLFGTKHEIDNKIDAPLSVLFVGAQWSRKPYEEFFSLNRLLYRGRQIKKFFIIP